MRKNVGGGSFLAGYKRHFADYSSFEVGLAAGCSSIETRAIIRILLILLIHIQACKCGAADSGGCVWLLTPVAPAC